MAEWYPAAKTGEVVEGLPLLVSLNGLDICLLRHADRFYAIDDVCSHAEASLSEGEQHGAVIECPRHGGRFDIRTGQAVHYPAFAPVATYPVKVEDDTIWIAVD
jgi:nitrite reductase/ring-hydroxylating ferredoxin subunit